jgi:hypothetical protein
MRFGRRYIPAEALRGSTKPHEIEYVPNDDSGSRARKTAALQEFEFLRAEAVGSQGAYFSICFFLCIVDLHLQHRKAPLQIPRPAVPVGNQTRTHR